MNLLTSKAYIFSSIFRVPGSCLTPTYAYTPAHPRDMLQSVPAANQRPGACFVSMGWSNEAPPNLHKSTS